MNKKGKLFRLAILAGTTLLTGCSSNIQEKAIQSEIEEIKQMGIEDEDVIDTIDNFLKTGSLSPLKREGYRKLDRDREDIIQIVTEHINDTLIEGSQQSAIDYDTVSYNDEKKKLILDGNRKNSLEIAVEDTDGMIKYVIEKREQAKVLIQTYDQISPMRSMDDKVREMISIIKDVAKLTNEYDLAWQQDTLVVSLNEKGKEKQKIEEKTKELDLSVLYN